MDRLILSNIASHMTIRNLCGNCDRDNIRTILRQKIDYAKNEGVTFKKFLWYRLDNDKMLRVTILCNEYISSLAIVTVNPGGTITLNNAWNMNMDYRDAQDIHIFGNTTVFHNMIVEGWTPDVIESDRVIHPVKFIMDYRDEKPIYKNKGYKSKDLIQITNSSKPIPQELLGKIEYPKGDILDHLTVNSYMEYEFLCVILIDLASHGYWNEWTSNIKGSSLLDNMDNIDNYGPVFYITVPSVSKNPDSTARLTRDGRMTSLQYIDITWAPHNILYNSSRNVYINEITGEVLGNSKSTNITVTLLRSLESVGVDSRNIYV